jgi:hypothetical protein
MQVGDPACLLIGPCRSCLSYLYTVTVPTQMQSPALRDPSCAYLDCK